jgi:hypothetical protein
MLIQMNGRAGYDSLDSKHGLVALIYRLLGPSLLAAPNVLTLSRSMRYRSVSPGLDGPPNSSGGGGGPAAALLNSSLNNRSGSLPRPTSPSPSLTSDKLEQDFQVNTRISL